MCTWITQCMRCDGWGRVFFYLLRENFREKIRFAVRAFARVFPDETARVHRGDTEERSGGVRLCCARSACRLGKNEEKSQGRGAFRKSCTAPLMRERPLASLMTCSRVLV